VLENLLADHDVESVRDGHGRTDVEFRIVEARIFPPRLAGVGVAAYFGGGARGWVERRDVGVDRLVQDNSLPLVAGRRRLREQDLLEEIRRFADDVAGP
jgi:hypothetical protein